MACARTVLNEVEDLIGVGIAEAARGAKVLGEAHDACGINTM